jgi:hypothetical protein
LKHVNIDLESINHYNPQGKIENYRKNGKVFPSFFLFFSARSIVGRRPYV